MLLARAEAVKGGGAGGELGLGDERNAHGEREGADRENDSELKSKKVRERGEDMGGHGRRQNRTFVSTMADIQLKHERERMPRFSSSPCPFAHKSLFAGNTLHHSISSCWMQSVDMSAVFQKRSQK